MSGCFVSQCRCGTKRKRARNLHLYRSISDSNFKLHVQNFLISSMKQFLLISNLFQDFFFLFFSATNNLRSHEVVVIAHQSIDLVSSVPRLPDHVFSLVGQVVNLVAHFVHQVVVVPFDVSYLNFLFSSSSPLLSSQLWIFFNRVDRRFVNFLHFSFLVDHLRRFWFASVLDVSQRNIFHASFGEPESRGAVRRQVVHRLGMLNAVAMEFVVAVQRTSHFALTVSRVNRLRVLYCVPSFGNIDRRLSLNHFLNFTQINDWELDGCFFI